MSGDASGGTRPVDAGLDVATEVTMDATVDAGGAVDATTGVAPCASTIMGPAGGTLVHPGGATMVVPVGALAVPDFWRPGTVPGRLVADRDTLRSCARGEPVRSGTRACRSSQFVSSLSISRSPGLLAEAKAPGGGRVGAPHQHAARPVLSWQP